MEIFFCILKVIEYRSRIRSWRLASGMTSLGCRAENRTLACLTLALHYQLSYAVFASQRYTDINEICILLKGIWII
jgi:hypothetical protein